MENIKKFISVVLLLILLTSCGSNITTDSDNSNIVGNVTTENVVSKTEDNTIQEDSEIDKFEKVTPEKIELKTSNLVKEKITLNWDSIDYSWDKAFVSWSKLTIVKAWNYEIYWKLDDGQIIVETDDDEAVQIILSWVEISNSNTSPIFVKNAKQTIITLADWTKNIFKDTENYSFEWDEDEPNATIFAKDELVIMWEWSLEIEANYNDWMSSKDNLVIYSWNISIKAADDWIRWKDYVLIEWWDIDINAKWDAIKSDKEDKWVIVINDWNIEITCWDDWVHAENNLEVNWWNILIKESYEWLESKILTINWWNIDLTSSDDWLNAAWWRGWEMWWPWWDRWTPPEDMVWQDFDQIRTIMDKQRNWEPLTEEEQTLLDEMKNNRQWQTPPDGFDWTRQWWPQMWEMAWSSDYFIYINWWVIKVNANGDWLDANGSIIMTGWEVYVNWPTSSWNWPLDYDGTFNISWWIVIAAWSSWMAQNISDTSLQNWVLFGFDSMVSAWTVFTIKDSSWNEVINFTPSKNYQSVAVSSPELKKWEYSYYLWDEEKWTFTIFSVTTTVWTIWRWWMMWGGMRWGMR